MTFQTTTNHSEPFSTSGSDQIYRRISWFGPNVSSQFGKRCVATKAFGCTDRKLLGCHPCRDVAIFVSRTSPFTSRATTNHGTYLIACWGGKCKLLLLNVGSRKLRIWGIKDLGEIHLFSLALTSKMRLWTQTNEVSGPHNLET